MKFTSLLSLILVITFIQRINATKYYCDPVSGSTTNNGLSTSTAWPALATIVSQKNFTGGDTIYLMTGNHGTPYISKIYSEDVIVTPFSGEEPIIKFIVFSGAKHWKLDSLTISSEGVPVRFDPPLEHPVYPIKDNSLVQITDNSSYITLENCLIESVDNSSEWTKDDWNYKAWNGINSVNNNEVIIRNCHLKNINFGINNSSSSKNNLYEYNTIENFSGDGMRGHGTNTVIQYNVIKNAYNTNGNHDDMIQAFQGDQYGLVLRGNKLIAYTNSDQPFKSACQGIGFFDGIYHDFVIENNIVVTSHWHGITLLGADNCKIVNNTVVDIDMNDSSKPWIMIDNHKDGTPSSNCIIRNNISFDIRKGVGVTADHNQTLSLWTYNNYFVDYDNLDLQLKQESSAVDAGSDDGAPSIDILGNSRPQGEGYDIGAYELETTTGAERIKFKDNPSLELYPNPTSGKLNYKFPVLFTGKIIISDITGKIVFEKEILSQEGSFDLSDKNKGTYFVQFDSEINSRYKIIKL